MRTFGVSISMIEVRMQSDVFVGRRSTVCNFVLHITDPQNKSKWKKLIFSKPGTESIIPQNHVHNIIS